MRCKLVVREELKKLSLLFSTIDLGFVELSQELTTKQKEELRVNLLKHGLELMDDKKSILVERIKNVITETIHSEAERMTENFSDYLSKKLNYEYNYLSNIFTEVKGMSIQQFMIINKIEKVKELILYDELNLSEIAHRLNYSSSAHLSNQFRKITGLTPSYYKRIKGKRNNNLENL